jgi:hypothetical protein
MHGDLFTGRVVDVNNDLTDDSGYVNDAYGLDDGISASNIHLPGPDQVVGNVEPWNDSFISRRTFSMW